MLNHAIGASAAMPGAVEPPSMSVSRSVKRSAAFMWRGTMITLKGAETACYVWGVICPSGRNDLFATVFPGRFAGLYYATLSELKTEMRSLLCEHFNSQGVRVHFLRPMPQQLCAAPGKSSSAMNASEGTAKAIRL